MRGHAQLLFHGLHLVVCARVLVCGLQSGLFLLGWWEAALILERVVTQFQPHEQACSSLLELQKAVTIKPEIYPRQELLGRKCAEIGNFCLFYAMLHPSKLNVWGLFNQAF
jgi:hypothetical protein